ncbi:glycoside hydrolase family 73 protein [Latilactobacillus sakei]
MKKILKRTILIGTVGLVTVSVQSVMAADNNQTTPSSSAISTSEVSLSESSTSSSTTTVDSQSATKETHNNSESQAKPQNNVILKQNTQIGPGFYADDGLMMRSSLARTDTRAFLESIRQGSINSWNKYGVLPSTVAAQAILESGWGGSRLSTLANNLFGIKGNYNGASISMPTQEYINGRWITINDNFRKYPSRNASVEDHGRFLNDNSRYHNLLWQTDYRKVTRLLQNDGYATAPTYAASLNRIIEQYHLNDWDNERVVQKSLVKMVGKVNGGQPMYWLLNTGMQLSGSNTNRITNKAVTVTQWIKTSANKEYYLANVDGKTVAWIPKSTFSESESVVARKQLKLTGHVNGGQPMYWLLNTGMQLSGSNTNRITNKTVTVTQWIKTSANKEYYLANVDGKTVAWIPKSTFSESEKVIARKRVKLTGHVKGGQSMYWLLSSGITLSGLNTNSIVNKTVTITQWIKTSANKEYYLVNVNGQVVAWASKAIFVQ